MENPRLRLLRTGKTRPCRCRCSRRWKGQPRRGRGCCKNHYRPAIYGPRQRWREWERRARFDAEARDEAPSFAIPAKC